MRSVVRGARSNIGARVARLRPGRLPLPILLLVLACWAATVVIAVILLIPNALTSDAQPGGGLVAAPWFQVVALVACAILASGFVLVLLLGARPRIPPAAAVVATAAYPFIALLAGGYYGQSTLVLTAALVALVLLLVRQHQKAGSRALDTPVAALAAVPWLVAAVVQGAASDGDSQWVALGLFAVSASVASFLAFYGVARAAEKRNARARPLLRRPMSHRTAALILAAIVAVVILRLTVARGLFGDLDHDLWSLRGVASWPHAVIVAAVMVGAVLRSEQHPLVDRGQKPVTALLVVAGTLDFILFALVALAAMAAAIFRVALPDAVFGFEAITPYLAIALVVGLTVFLIMPSFRGTVGRVMALVSLLYLLPPLSAVAAGEAWDELPAFWSSPVQVVVVLTGAALGVLAWSTRNTSAIRPGLAAKLATVPLIAVHAAVLLPAAWSEALGRQLLVLGVIAGLLLFMPKVAADPVRHARTVVGASIAGLFALTVFALSIPSLFESDTVSTLGVLWLAVPVGAALCLRVSPKERSRIGLQGEKPVQDPPDG